MVTPYATQMGAWFKSRRAPLARNVCPHGSSQDMRHLPETPARVDHEAAPLVLWLVGDTHTLYQQHTRRRGVGLGLGLILASMLAAGAGILGSRRNTGDGVTRLYDTQG